MLRTELRAGLGALGLAHLLDRPATVTRADELLHALPTCPRAAVGTAEVLTLPLREVSPDELCSCVSQTRSAPFGALYEAVGLVSEMGRRPVGPGPSGTSVRALQAVARRVRDLEEVLSSYYWLRVSDPDVVPVRDRLEVGLRSELDSHLERLRSHGAAAVLLQDAVTASTWGGDLSGVWPTLSDLVGSNAAAAFLNHWALLVERGADRDVRRRRLSALLGSALRRSGTPDPLRDAVLQGLEAFEVLESRLEGLLASPAPRLLQACTYSRNDATGYERLVLESFSLACRGGWWLLAAPERVLERSSSEDRTRNNRRAKRPVPVPDDPRHLDTLVGLWDPTTTGQLSTPRGALEAAVLV